MSPRFDARGLSRRYSRKRPCGRGVVPPFGGVTFPRLGPFTSTSLLPFAPPRLAARLPRYYESSDFCRAASSDLTGIAKFVPLRRAILHPGPGPLLTPRPPLRVLTMDRPRPSPDRSPGLSRLTFQPLHLQPPHCHFVTVALARYFSAVTCRVYPPGQPIQVEGMAVARSRVRSSPGASPTGLAESSSLALRMGRSSQIALHLSSRKRSYHCRLQAGNVSLEGTCTLLIKRLHRPHWHLDPPGKSPAAQQSDRRRCLGPEGSLSRRSAGVGHCRKRHRLRQPTLARDRHQPFPTAPCGPCNSLRPLVAKSPGTDARNPRLRGLAGYRAYSGSHSGGSTQRFRATPREDEVSFRPLGSPLRDIRLKCLLWLGRRAPHP